MFLNPFLIVFVHVHIKILVTSNVGLILRSIPVASASRSSCKVMLRVLYIYATALCGSSCWSSCGKSSQLLKLTVDTAVLCYMTLYHFCLPLSVLLLLIIILLCCIFIFFELYSVWLEVFDLMGAAYFCDTFSLLSKLAVTSICILWDLSLNSM